MLDVKRVELRRYVRLVGSEDAEQPFGVSLYVSENGPHGKPSVLLRVQWSKPSAVHIDIEPSHRRARLLL